MSNHLLTILSYLRGQSFFLEGRADDLGQIHSILHQVAQATLDSLLGTDALEALGAQGIEQRDLEEFRKWARASDLEAVQMQKSLRLFRVEDPWLVDNPAADGMRVSSRFQPYLEGLLALPSLQTFLQSSRNSSEKYLQIIQALLANEDSPQSLGLPNDDALVGLVWESLAQVDAALDGAPIESMTSNRKLQGIYREQAINFLRSRNIEPMAAGAALIEQGAIRAGMMYEGQGAVYLKLLNNLLELVSDPRDPSKQVPTFPAVYALYQAVKDVYKTHPVNPIDVDKLRALNLEDNANWKEINGVARSLPVIELYQILRTRWQDTYGYRPSSFKAASGQSQGLLRAHGFAGSFESPDFVEPLVPTGIGGYRSLQAIKDEMMWTGIVGYLFQEHTGDFDGLKPVLSISKIPYDKDDANSTLALLIRAVNAHLIPEHGEFDHVAVGNTTVGHPYYFNLLTGTTEGITEIQRLIETKNAEGYSDDIQELVQGLPTGIKIFDHEFLGITSASHHAGILQPAYEESVAFAIARGINLRRPRITVIATDNGEDLSQTSDGHLPRLATQLYKRAVDMPGVVNAMAQVTDVMLDGGPDNVVARNFSPKIQDRVPMLALDAASDERMITIRVPSQFLKAIGKQAPEEAKSPMFENMDGVKILRSSLEEGSRQIYVDIVGDVNPKEFRDTFLKQTRGPIRTLLGAEKLSQRGIEVENYLVRLTKPSKGMGYGWIVDAGQELTLFAVDENGKNKVTIEAPDAQGVIAVHEYTYANGRADLIRRYRVNGDQVIQVMDDYVEQGRLAYAQDWGFKLDGIFNEDFETLPNDLLSRAAFTYEFNLTEAMMVDQAKSVGSKDEKCVNHRRKGGVEGHPTVLENVVAREGILKLLFVKAFGIDLPSIIDLGGSKWKEAAPIRAGQYTIEARATSLDDMNDGTLQGRRLIAHVIIRHKESGRVIAEFKPQMVSTAVSNNLAVGTVKHVVAPQADTTPDFDFLAGFKIYTHKNKNVVARGTVTIPLDAADRYVVDQNRIHVSNVSAQLSGKRAKIMQGQATLARMHEEVVKVITGGHPERVQGANKLSDAPQFKGYVYLGDTLSYRVTRLREAEGLNEYKVEVFRTAADGTESTLVLDYMLYAWDEAPVYMFTGQGDQYPGMNLDLKKDPTRAARLAEIQAIVDKSSHPINLDIAMERGSSDTKETQPIYGAYDVVYFEWLRAQGLIHRDAIYMGHSYGMYPAIWAAGGLDTDEMLFASSERGATMGNFVKPNNPQGMVAFSVQSGSPESKVFVKEIEALCVEISQPDADPPSTVEVANDNHPAQVVLSGHLSAFQRLQKRMTADPTKWSAVRTTPVPVNTAFHATPMKPAAANMGGYYANRNPYKPAINRVIMDTTADDLPADPALIAPIMAEQVAKRVRFRESVEKLLKEGRRVFREIGPAGGENKSTLVGLVKKIADAMRVLKEVDARYMNPDRGPDDWDFVTHERLAKPPKAAAVVPKPESKEEEKPAAGVPSATPDPAAVPTAVVEQKPIGPVWKEVATTDLQKALGALAQLTVNLQDPLQDGTDRLLAHFEANKAGIDVLADQDVYAKLAQKIAEPHLISLQPNAIGMLEEHEKYLRGILGLDGFDLIPSTLWTKESVGEAIIGIFKRRFPEKVNDETLQAALVASGEKTILTIPLEDGLKLDSTDVADTWTLVVTEFGIGVQNTDQYGKKGTLGKLADFVFDRLQKPIVTPLSDQALAVRHFLGLIIRAEQFAIAALKAEKAKAEAEAVVATVVSSPEQAVQAVVAGMSEEDQAAFEAKIQMNVDAKLNEQAHAITRALGLKTSELKPIEVDRKTGKIRLLGEGKRLAEAERAAAAKRNTGTLIENVLPTYNPKREYFFGRTEWNGAPQNLQNFIAKIRLDKLPTDARDLKAAINHLANQLDDKLLARLENHFLPSLVGEFGGGSRQVALAEQLASRTKASLAAARAGKGGLFDNVITLKSFDHLPVWGEFKTRLQDRGLSTLEMLDLYERSGLNPQMVQALRELILDGGNLTGVDVMVTGPTGTLAEPFIAMLLQLGARVIAIDRKGKNDKTREGETVASFFKRMRNLYGVRGMDDQVVIEPNVHMVSHDDVESVFNQLKGKGYRVRGIFNLAAVSDYGAPEALGDPFTMLGVYTLFTKTMAALWGKLAIAEGKTDPIIISDHPTPNHNDIKGTGNYWLIKKMLEDGTIEQLLKNEGLVHKSTGQPVVKGFSILTPWANPERPIDLSKIDPAKAQLMEMLAMYADEVKVIAREEYGVDIYTTVGREPAIMTVAGFVKMLKVGNEAPLHMHYDQTDFGFMALKAAVEARGETLDDVIEKAKDRVDARHGAEKANVQKSKTDPTRLPNNGYPVDLNALARRVIIDPRGAQGRFDAKVPYALHPGTSTVLGAGAVGLAPDLHSNFSELLRRTAPNPEMILPETAWLFERDNLQLARALKMSVKSLSKEEIEERFGKKIDLQVGFRRPAEASHFKTTITLPSPIDIEMPIPAIQTANFERYGWEVLQDAEGRVIAKLAQGKPMPFPIEKEWPVSVWGDIPGGLAGFDFPQFGITSEKDLNFPAPATYLQRMAVAQVVMMMGESAKGLVGIYGAEAIFSSMAVALADMVALNNITVGPKEGHSAHAAAMNKLLADAASGQISMEQLGIMGDPWSVVGACATGVFNLINAVRQMYAAMWKKEHMRQEGVAPKLGFISSSDYASFFNMIFGFYAVGALHTDEYAEEHDVADDGRSMPGDQEAGGFVPGVASGALAVGGYQWSLDEGFVPWSSVIGDGTKTDGARAKAREMFGDGVKASIREAIRAAKEVLPKNPNDFIIVVDAHLTSTGGDTIEMEAVSEVLAKELSLPKGYPIYVQALKAQVGHGLGGATSYAAAIDQETLHRRYVIGNPNLSNIKSEIAELGHLVLVNEATDLNHIYPKDKPILLLLNGFGFNGKNGVVVLVVPSLVYTDEARAVASMAKQLRHAMQAQADLLAERQDLRTMVQYFDKSSKHPVSTYPDLWAVYSRSQAIAEILVKEVRFGKRELNFLNPLQWAPMLPYDSDISKAQLSPEEVAMDAAFGRIHAIIRDLQATGDIEAIREREKTEHQADHPVWKIGASDGMGLRRLLAEIEAGALTHVVQTHFDPNFPDRQYNAKAVRLYAASKGISIELFHTSAILINSKTHKSAFHAGEPTKEDLDIRKRFEPIAEALKRAQANSVNKDGILDNSVAFGAPKREPGLPPIQVPSMNALGEFYMATVAPAATQEDADTKTIDTMGRNPPAMLHYAKFLDFFGPTSKSYQYNWRNGKKQTGTRGLGGVYYYGGLLGISKDIAGGGILDFRRENPNLGDHKELEFPAFMSGALGAIEGGWPFGSIGQDLMEANGTLMTMEKLATQSILRAWDTPRDVMEVDIDSHEAAIMDQALDQFELLRSRIETYTATYPNELIEDPDRPSIQYIPKAASDRVIRKGIISDKALQVLDGYLKPEEKRAMEIAKGPSPLHGGAVSINPLFKVPKVEIANGSYSIRFVLPDNFNGYSGITHGGMLDGIFESYLRALADRFPLIKKKISEGKNDMIRHIAYKAKARAGSSVVLTMILPSKRPYDALTLQMDQDGKIIAEAKYSRAKRLKDENNMARLEIVNAKTGDQETVEIPKKAEIKPGMLQADQEFSCLPNCVAGGHSHASGLQFKYAFDKTHNTLWGVIDTLKGQDPIYSVMLAGDDMAAWTGMRSSKFWGYTATNSYIPVTPLKAGERLFLVAQPTKGIGIGNFQVTVSVMDAYGTVKGILRADYVMDEEASFNGLKGAIEAVEAGDELAMKTLYFLRDSMGDDYEPLLQGVDPEFDLSMAEKAIAEKRAVVLVPANGNEHVAFEAFDQHHPIFRELLPILEDCYTALSNMSRSYPKLINLIELLKKEVPWTGRDAYNAQTYLDGLRYVIPNKHEKLVNEAMLQCFSITREKTPIEGYPIVDLDVFISREADMPDHDQDSANLDPVAPQQNQDERLEEQRAAPASDGGEAPHNSLSLDHLIQGIDVFADPSGGSNLRYLNPNQVLQDGVLQVVNGQLALDSAEQKKKPDLKLVVDNTRDSLAGDTDESEVGIPHNPLIIEPALLGMGVGFAPSMLQSGLLAFVR